MNFYAHFSIFSQAKICVLVYLACQEKIRKVNRHSVPLLRNTISLWEDRFTVSFSFPCGPLTTKKLTARPLRYTHNIVDPIVFWIFVPVDPQCMSVIAKRMAVNRR